MIICCLVTLTHASVAAMNYPSSQNGHVEAQASQEAYDEPQSDSGSMDEEHDLKQERDSSATSPTTSTTPTKAGAKPNAHLQKRRRVTRACDECRRKKIKCDGKQPCTHCTVYSYDCTFDQPSNRRRNPAPQYVESLEHRVHRAETLLHILIPNLDLDDPGIDAAVAQGWIPGAPGKGNPLAPGHELKKAHATRPQALATQHESNKSDTNLESMVRAVAQMDMDEQGYWDYHGHSSGLSFVRRMREQLGDLMGPETVATPFIKSRPYSQILDSPKSADSPFADLSPSALELPPQALARRICGNAVDDASALLRVVHKPSFWNSFEQLYSSPPEHYSNEDNKFLPLFHSTMALGHLFGKDEHNSLDRQGYESAIQLGFEHFKTARHLMDITDCRDLTSIQAVVFMILFMQSSAKLSQCYAYVGVALRSALRMGLHRSYAGTFGPVEAETRKRVFWVVRKMDIYVGAMLGLPQTLSDEDIDQDFPLEVDDEYISIDGIRPMPEGQVSVFAAFNAHTRIVQLITKIVRKVYPIKVATQQGAAEKSYTVPFSAIREIESDLEKWKNDLPPILSPCEAPERYTRIQQLLRLTYAHAQVMLYRPFLHFVAMDKRSKPVDQRAYACAASYVNVSRNIIHITSQMKQKGLLNGAHWFIMYTSFFAILSLVYFAAENPDNATTQAVMRDALEGKETLDSLSRRSMAADRCTATLSVVFQRLPDWMRNGQQNPMASTKKRSHDASPHPSSLDASKMNPKASRSHPDIQVASQGPVRRASTFPMHGPAVPATHSQIPPPPSWSQSGASTYSPQTPISTGYDPNTLSGFGQSSGGLGGDSLLNYGMPQNFSNPALPDLSAMMFPAADEPFGYPNQPLTTFENTQQFGKNDAFMNAQAFAGVHQPNAMGATPLSRGRDDNLEAQFFALPPYMSQGQRPRQQHHQQQQQQHGMPNMMPDPMSFSNGGSMGMAGDPSGTNWGRQDEQSGQGFQPEMSNINIGDIFGGSELHPWFQHQ